MKGLRCPSDSQKRLKLSIKLSIFLMMAQMTTMTMMMRALKSVIWYVIVNSDDFTCQFLEVM